MEVLKVSAKSNPNSVAGALAGVIRERGCAEMQAIGAGALNQAVKQMAVKIRLRRMGAKKSPFYRIVVADSRYPRDGRFIEEIGYYNPMEEPSVVKVDPEKAKKWIANGAQPTDTVKALFKKHGVL